MSPHASADLFVSVVAEIALKQRDLQMHEGSFLGLIITIRLQRDSHGLARDRPGLARDDYPSTMLAQYISLRRETAQEQATQS
jgi:hypothetical protein